MIFKLLAALFVLFLIYLIFFKKSREQQVKQNSKELNEEIMIECPTCKTFISKQDAILSNGRYFCSKECL
jgi:uncharacterized protein